MAFSGGGGRGEAVVACRWVCLMVMLMLIMMVGVLDG